MSPRPDRLADVATGCVRVGASMSNIWEAHRSSMVVRRAGKTLGPRPIIVLGTARSGTTLITNYLGSVPTVCNLGEYQGLHVAYGTVPRQIGWDMAGFPKHYQASLREHARSYPRELASSLGAEFFVDGSPANLEVADSLVRDLPDAIFVLMLRHFTGVVQSLERGTEDGWYWMPTTTEGRGALWASYYGLALALPKDRIVPLSYDHLCADPSGCLREFSMAMRGAGFIGTPDQGVLGHSHAANPERRRHRILRRSGRLGPIPSFDSEHWSAEDERILRPVVGSVDADLRGAFPGHYRSPIGYSSGPD